MLVTEALLSLPMSTDESLDIIENLLEDTMDGLLSLEIRVMDDISLMNSGSGEGVCDLEMSGDGVGASGEGGAEGAGDFGKGFRKPRIRDHNRNNSVSIICL